jgi:hypothetical protein
MGYDQLLFRDGTLTECGITHGKAVEIYAPGRNSATYHNEGLQFIVMSFLPFLIGLACFLFSVTSQSSEGEAADWRAFFLFLGVLLLVPSALIFVIGMVLVPECSTPCYFSGTSWW